MLPKLPNLPDLNIDIKKDVVKKKNEFNENNVDQGEPKRIRPKVPKSEYDSDGNPMLTIPDIDDVALTAEIDRYFGTYEEDD